MRCDHAYACSGHVHSPVSEFILGVKRNALEPGELITAFSIPIVRGTQEYLKIGKRNAMVIAVANLALNVDTKRKQVACVIGSVGQQLSAVLKLKNL